MALTAQGQGDALTDDTVVFDQQYTWNGLSVVWRSPDGRNFTG